MGQVTADISMSLLEAARVIDSPGVTHLKYRVVK
jgi:hypothetical protein